MSLVKPKTPLTPPMVFRYSIAYNSASLCFSQNILAYLNSARDTNRMVYTSSFDLGGSILKRPHFRIVVCQNTERKGYEFHLYYRYSVIFGHYSVEYAPVKISGFY